MVSTTCDRRLSRAARAIIHDELKFASRDPALENNFWDLLHSLLSTPAASNTSCGLTEKQDIFQISEESTMLVKPTNTRTGTSVRTAAYKNPTLAGRKHQWYRCMLCGKTFTGRFYLDRHMERYHLENNSVLNSTSVPICPGDTWCHALPSCADKAMELEPYYGPGSEGHSSDMWEVLRRNLDEVHARPCDDNLMQEKKEACHQLVYGCFGGDQDLKQRLDRSICGKITCHGRIRRMLVSTNPSFATIEKRIHEWQADWDFHYLKYHEVGWIAIAAFLLLLLWYGCILHAPTYSSRLTRSNHRGHQLLRKSSSSTSDKQYRAKKKRV